MPEIPSQIDISHQASNQILNSPEIAGDNLDIYLTPDTYFADVKPEGRKLGHELLVNQARAWVSEYDTSGALLNALNSSGTRKDKGVPRASIKLGKMINLNSLESLLDVTTKSVHGYDVRRNLTPDEYDNLIKTAPNQGLMLIVRMLKDVTYPRENDGVHPVLEPAKIVDVQKVMSFGNDKDQMLCGDAEGLFMDQYYQLNVLKAGDQIVAIQKTIGEKTAMLTQDCLLNGVLIPRGSIMIVGEDENGNQAFSFGRLSAFSVDSPAEIERMAPDLTSNSLFQHNVSNYDKILEKLGVVKTISVEGLSSFIEEVDSLEVDDSEVGRIMRILAKKEESIATHQEGYDDGIRILENELADKYTNIDTYYDSSDSSEDRARKDAKAQEKQDDYDYLRSRLKSTMNPRVAYVRAYKALGKMFGADKVSQVIHMMAERSKAKKVISNVNKIAEEEQRRTVEWREKRATQERNYAMGRIETAIESADWKELAPNYLHEIDLPPQQLSSKNIFEMIQVMKQSEIPEVFEIEGLGHVEKVGEDGESKTVFVLTTSEGKKMVLKKASILHSGDKKATIPGNTNITYVSRNIDGKVLSEYSDLRTYLSMPLDTETAFVLQEYGGVQAEGGWRIAIASRHAEKNIMSKFPDLDKHSMAAIKRELGHRRHYLQKSPKGRALVIDIPVQR